MALTGKTEIEAEIKKALEKPGVKEMNIDDLKDAVEISDNIYWVGERTNSVLERNIYLRVFKNAGQSINMVIDPGPPEDLDILTRKAGKIIGDIRNIHIAFINHQDPDVGMNAAYLQRMRSKMMVMATDDTWRLIRFYGLNQQYFKSVNSFKGYQVVLPTGHALKFIPTPFCHFKGACMLYDIESRILFSGDLLGGTGGASGLYATDANWEGVQIFHQLYMPIKEAIQRAIDAIWALEPKPIAIAPQHGGILQGAVMEQFLERLYRLPVGLDLLREDKVKFAYINAINNILHEIKSKIGESFFAKVQKKFHIDGSFPDLIKLKEDMVVDISVDAMTGFKIFVNALTVEGETQEIKNILEMLVVRGLLDNNLPLMEFHKDEEFDEVELFEA
ncbi:MAG: MBL fold hydrolase [Deltaproteobacteria bacterium]|nr:MBL fold hydrolase [Deltaproteobacteria bacterium]